MVIEDKITFELGKESGPASRIEYYWAKPNITLSQGDKSIVIDLSLVSEEKSQAMGQWCYKTFGAQDSIEQWNRRWFVNKNFYWFKDESDRTLFLLKWSQ